MDSSASRQRINTAVQTNRKNVPKSISYNKCPIYVHKPYVRTQELIIPRLYQQKLDEEKRAKQEVERTKSKVDNKTYIDKIEETYWSQWRPNKNEVQIQASKIREAFRKTGGDGDDLKKISEILKPNKFRMRSSVELDKKWSKLPKIDEVLNERDDVEDDSKFLKHVDSIILNSKRQSEPKSPFPQPTSLRLFRKTSVSNHVKGGSYPLRPCLKKDPTKRQSAVSSQSIVRPKRK